MSKNHDIEALAVVIETLVLVGFCLDILFNKIKLGFVVLLALGAVGCLPCVIEFCIEQRCSLVVWKSVDILLMRSSVSA
jgi:hypothetical protein